MPLALDRQARQKAYNQKRRLDPEFRKRAAEYAKLWRERNPGWQKARYQKRCLDPEFRARKMERQRLWHERNPGWQKAYDQRRHMDRRLDPEFRARNAELARLFRVKSPRYMAGYVSRRRKNDPAFRILSNCQRRLSHALRGVGAKSARTLELIGCTGQQLKLHLEAQFRPDMNWENYGTLWQIDHIFPCAKFDLSCPLQQRQCFHFSNLQPLTVEENLLKRDN